MLFCPALQAASRRIPASFATQSDVLRLHGALLGTGAAVADVMRSHRSSSTHASDASGLGGRLPVNMGGLGAVTGHPVAGYVAAAMAEQTSYAAGSHRFPGAPGGQHSAVPAPSPDSRAALKAALDGLETTGITDEMEAAEVRAAGATAAFVCLPGPCGGPG